MNFCHYVKGLPGVLRGIFEGHVVVLLGFEELKFPDLSNPKDMVLRFARCGDFAAFCFLSTFSRGIVVSQAFICP